MPCLLDFTSILSKNNLLVIAKEWYDMARNPKKVSDLMFRAIIGWLLLVALIPLFVLTFYLSKEEAASVKPVNEVLDQNQAGKGRLFPKQLYV